MNDVIRLQRATAVLKAADYARARAFYCDRLGFAVVEEGGAPPRFGIFERDGAILFVNAWDGGPTRPGVGWAVYIHVTGLAALHRKLCRDGGPQPTALRVTAYGMRECEIADPDGNILCFGEDAGSGQGDDPA